MLLTGQQSTETSCMYWAQKQAACRDAAYWFTEHRNKLRMHVGKTSVMKPYNNPWPYISEPDSNPLHQ